MSMMMQDPMAGPGGPPPMGPPPEGGADMGALAAALGGGGGAPPMEGGGMNSLSMLAEGPGAGMEVDEEMETEEEMGPIEHIRIAIEHLKMAFDGDDDDQRKASLIGGLGGLQKILGGEAAKTGKVRQALGG